jgi:hypothetical protein
LTWAEYNFLDLGHEVRYEKQLDMLRNVIASMFNSSGFSKKTVRARDIMELPYVDIIKPQHKPNRVPDEFIKRALAILNSKN